MLRAKQSLGWVIYALVVVAALAFFSRSFDGARAAPLATTRYVAASGSDSGNNCAASGSPCRTIQRAANQSASGDTIKAAHGTYTYDSASDTCAFLQTRAVVCFVDKALTILGVYTTSNWTTANPSVNVTIIDGQSRPYAGAHDYGADVYWPTT